MPRYIDADKAYKVLTEYYNHKTAVQHEALKEALGKVPTADVVSVPTYAQMMWERNVAIDQLKEIGKGFGEKMDDVETVVRCKDCTYYQEGFRGEHWCTKHSSAYSIMQWGVKEDDYCSWGERKEDGTT